MKNHIIVVEDEPVTRALYTAYLERADYRVSPVENGAQLQAALPADLVLLDLELPGDDGLRIARELRARSPIPIIIVTRRGEAIDRVLGLELGADDYLVKPPEMRELLARVKNLLWRTTRGPEPAQRFGDWTLDRARQCLVADGAAVPLTSAELRVLAALVDARGAIVARSVLDEMVGGGNRSLDVIMNRLRRKLGEGGSIVARVILTVHGVGYRLGVPVE